MLPPLLAVAIVALVAAACSDDHRDTIAISADPESATETMRKYL